ncbi:hypothetical protein D3C79_620330 [compost metagenome]
MIFADAPAGEHHALAFLKPRVFAVAYRTGEIDARHHRELADDLAFAGDRQCIFIVKAGPVDVNRHIAIGQLIAVDVFDLSQSLIVLLFQ